MKELSIYGSICLVVYGLSRHQSYQQVENKEVKRNPFKSLE